MLSIEMAVPAPSGMRPGSWYFSAMPNGFARWREDQQAPDDMHKSLACFVERHGLDDVPALDVRAP